MKIKITEQQKAIIMVNSLQKIAEKLKDKAQFSEFFYLNEIKKLGGDVDKIKQRVKVLVNLCIY